MVIQIFLRAWTKPSLLDDIFLLRRLEKSLTTTGGEIFRKCGPSTWESIKVCRGEQSWLQCSKEVLSNWWSTWSVKGGKQDDVDTFSYTLVSRKGSSSTRLSFHCFKESEKSLTKLQCSQPIAVAQAVPHVRTVDKGPKVTQTVWTEQKALKHTNTCTR